MKFILVPFLLVLLLTQTFSQWLVVAEYNWNREFIARNLCINRERPKLHCNGRCQMMKRLAEEEKQDSAGSKHSSGIKVQEQVFSDRTDMPAAPQLLLRRAGYNEYRLPWMTPSPGRSFFHPPTVA